MGSNFNVLPPMEANRRKSIRRTIGYCAKILASDGAWERDCRVIDVSQTGAKLAIEGSAKLPQNFVLALSAQGLATRRCRVVWATDQQIGVRFQREAAK